MVINSAAAAAKLVGSAPVVDAWDTPSALEGMTVGALAAHLVRATGATLAYLDRTDPTAKPDGELLTKVTYFHAAIDSPIHERIKEVSADEASAGHEAVSSRASEVAAELAERQLALPEPLHRVDVYQRVRRPRARQPGDLAHRVDRAELVRDEHLGDEHGVGAQHVAEVVEVERAFGVEAREVDLEAFVHQREGGLAHGGVFRRSDDHMATRVLARAAAADHDQCQAQNQTRATHRST